MPDIYSTIFHHPGHNRDFNSRQIAYEKQSSSPRSTNHQYSPRESQQINHYTMSTSHRGLPPPPPLMNMQDPIRQQPRTVPSHQQAPPYHSQPIPVPQPPQSQPYHEPPSQRWSEPDPHSTYWQSAELARENTRLENEKTKQEAERTKQQSYKFEQRLVEQSMLRESLKAGIPPQMVPVIFAGIGGLAVATAEMLYQYSAQLTASQQNVQTMDNNDQTNKDPRNHPVPQQTIQIQPPPPISQHQNTFPAYHTGMGNKAVPASHTITPRSIPSSNLSRINTIEVNTNSTAPSTAHHSAALQNSEQQAASSPSIYFHHWQPPATQETKGNQPPTPSGKNEPLSAHPSNAGDHDYRDSPRKRKATGGHQPIPAPTQHQQVSPSIANNPHNRGRAASDNQRRSNSHMRSQSNRSNEDPPSQSSSNVITNANVVGESTKVKASDGARRPPSRRDSVAASYHERGQNDSDYVSEAPQPTVRRPE